MKQVEKFTMNLVNAEDEKQAKQLGCDSCVAEVFGTDGVSLNDFVSPNDVEFVSAIATGGCMKVYVISITKTAAKLYNSGLMVGGKSSGYLGIETTFRATRIAITVYSRRKIMARYQALGYSASSRTITVNYACYSVSYWCGLDETRWNYDTYPFRRCAMQVAEGFIKKTPRQRYHSILVERIGIRDAAGFIHCSKLVACLNTTDKFYNRVIKPLFSDDRTMTTEGEL